MNSHTTADDASMVTTSSFASTISILKNKNPLGKEHKARKEEKNSEKKSKRSSLPKDSKTPAQRTAEHYQIYASMR